MHAQLDTTKLLDLSSLGGLLGIVENMLGGPISGILAKTLGAALYPEFDTYLANDDFDESATILDIYDFNSLDYYVSHSRNFGTETETDYRPFAIDKANHGFNSENFSFVGNFDKEAFEAVDDFLSSLS